MTHFYAFELRFTAPPGGDVIDALYEAGWDDAVISLDPCTGGQGQAMFDREAPSAVKAVVSAIRQGRLAGIELTGVSEDLVTFGEIAERTDRTFATADHWATGRRGPGGFPAPKVARPRVSLYSWAEVVMWLASHGLARMSSADVEIARVCEAADAMIRVQRLQSRLPAEDREALTDAVA
ncbi:hypothetical protein [Glycomyces xiaoerkulensis]|uniref:hypothetical protein n=1 Tax=Glycomyces xiaoerkulensis TaxID=2038139 RepID=UPI0012FFFA1E|nr:hypothetical protein [Glycomyces xiaoerkulensis]